MKHKTFDFEKFKKELDVFDKTSFLTYVFRGDWRNVKRKIRLTGRLRELKWYFLHRTIHRFHIVDTGLPPGYYDTDFLVLHSSFNLLKIFVEKERGGVESLDYWQKTKASKQGCTQKELTRLRADDKELKELYLWWTRERPKRNGFELDEKHYNEDTDMLCRLMKIRHRLWT